MKDFLLVATMFIFLLSSCRPAPEETEATPEEIQVPVTVSGISRQTMNEYVELNAISAFQLKSILKANANGYLNSATLKIGQLVNRGETLFTIKTKEAVAIGNSINQLDSNFHFSGVNVIKATEQGYITQVDHQSGDYVQDGEQLAIISNVQSFVFIMEMPFELRPLILNKKTVDLILPDSTIMPGVIASFMPDVDPVAQTQRVVIKVKSDHQVPENLIAKVRITKSEHRNAISLPKSAVLTNETQSEFWVVKLLNDTTAIKVPVEKGIENGGKVEIVNPLFTDSDRIVITGNYGLEDTVKVKVTDKKQ